MIYTDSLQDEILGFIVSHVRFYKDTEHKALQRKHRNHGINKPFFSLMARSEETVRQTHCLAVEARPINALLRFISSYIPDTKRLQFHKLPTKTSENLGSMPFHL